MKRKVYFETIPAIIINFLFGINAFLEFLMLHLYSDPPLFDFGEVFMLTGNIIFAGGVVLFILYNRERYRYLRAGDAWSLKRYILILLVPYLIWTIPVLLVTIYYMMFVY